jgi:hypothetical protein
MPVVTRENFKEIGAAFIARRGGGHVLIGFDTSARLWMAYYRSKGMPTAFMEQQLRAGKEYTVPCQRPADFDSETRISAASMPRQDKLASEMSFAERDAIVKRATAGMTFRPTKYGKYAQDDVREQKPQPPVARDLTDAERDSIQRLMGTRKDAAE